MSNPLAGIDVFVQTVQAGSFSKAAEQLHLSRSAVGKTIARLEQRLNTRLFHRTTRSQALTDDGQAFYEHCLRALAELDKGEKMLDSGRTEIAGLLRISMPVLYGRRIVAPVLIKLLHQHPQLKLELQFSDRISDLIEDGYDLAIRSSNLPDSTLLSARCVARQRMVVCAAPGWLHQHGTPRTLDELQHCRAVLYKRADKVHSLLFPQADGSTREIRPDSSLRLDDLETIADAVSMGLGIGWLPRWLIRAQLREGTLVTLFEEETPLKFDIHAVWPTTPSLPLRVRLAIDTLVEALPELTD